MRSVHRSLVVFALALLVSTGTVSAGEGLVLRPTGAPQDNPESVTGKSVAPKFTDRAADRLVVPFFKVDRRSASGETTLIAVRNVTNQAHDARIRYWVDRIYPSSPDVVQTFSLLPDEVVTINLRDLAGITGGAGGDQIIRGWLEVVHLDGSGDGLSGDWFRVNPAQDFATGGRMVDMDHSGTCTQWDFRYLVGGTFSGGTRLELFVDSPRGIASGAPPSATIDFYSEPGTFLGGVEVFSNRQVVELIASELLDLLPGSPANFGSMVVTFQSGTNGGLVTGTYRAEGRYSVGLNGTCVVP